MNTAAVERAMRTLQERPGLADEVQETILDLVNEITELWAHPLRHLADDRASVTIDIGNLEDEGE